MPTDRSVTPPRLITVPSSDRAFRAHVEAIATEAMHGPAGLERRLRRIFPRVIVRERELSGESPAWYVYRDGGWRTPADPWWEDGSLPSVVVSGDGWITDASATAAGLLGIDPAAASEHHFTDFAMPGTLEDSMALFATIESGSALTATVLLRPTSGDVIAVDLHASKRADDIIGVLRLATDVDIPLGSIAVPRPAAIITTPTTDVAFRLYALLAFERMPEPTIDGLALRLHRLYPHAAVRAHEDTWIADRDPRLTGAAQEAWWDDLALPRVRYDAQALILEANQAAQAFLGVELVGHYWQDFVTAGSTEEVGVMLEILGEVGAAESRFRMPRADGTLVEFDSYTVVTGEELVTVMRPVATPPMGERAAI